MKTKTIDTKDLKYGDKVGFELDGQHSVKTVKTVHNDQVFKDAFIVTTTDGCKAMLPRHATIEVYV